jgi:transposase
MMKASGMSLRKIAAALDVSTATVHRGLAAVSEATGSVTVRTADPASMISVP